jgi:arylsulfatase A
MMPTMAELLGTEITGTDGISLLPELMGNSAAQEKHEFLYWEYPETSGKQGLLYLNQWKLVRQGLHQDKHAPVELYDITNDIAEEHNLAAVYPALADRLFQLMMAQHIPFNEIWDLTLD